MGARSAEEDEELLSEEDDPLDPEDVSGFNWWENESDEDMDNVGLAAGL